MLSKGFMIKSIQKIVMLGFCLVYGIMHGMQPQVQSTSSATSIPAMAQLSQTGESKEISVPKIQRQHALVGSLLANPSPLQSFMSSNNVPVPVNNAGAAQSFTTNQAVALPVLNGSESPDIHWFYERFVCGIQQKSEQIVEMFLEQYAIGFEVIKQLISNAAYDDLDQLLDVIETYDLSFSIDEVPVANELTLLEFACECYYKDQTEIRKDIIKLLLVEEASIVEFVKENNPKWVDFLLKCGAIDTFDKDGFSELYKACSSQEMVTLLMDYKVEQYKSNSSYAALVEAVEKNDIAAAKKAIHQGINQPNIFDVKGNHLLAVAATHKNSELAELLLIFAHMKLDYLVTTGDYESLDFIIHSVNNYFLSQSDCTILLKQAQELEDDNIVALLTEVNKLAKSREKKHDDNEIKTMTLQPVKQAHYTEPERRFIGYIHQYNYQKAQEILAQNPAIRFALIKNLLTYVLSDPLASQRMEAQKKFVAFLLKNYLKQLCPMIENMLNNNQDEYFQKLIAYGLNYYDLWELGVFILEEVVDAFQPEQRSLEPVEFIVTEHNSVSNKKSKKRHLEEEKIIDSQSTDKRFKAEHKQQEKNEQTVASPLSLTPSLSETAVVHQTQPASLSSSFDPSHWLNAVSIS